jgi:hypothetical protein
MTELGNSVNPSERKQEPREEVHTSARGWEISNFFFAFQVASLQARNVLFACWMERCAPLCAGSPHSSNCLSATARHCLQDAAQPILMIRAAFHKATIAGLSTFLWRELFVDWKKP